MWAFLKLVFLKRSLPQVSSVLLSLMVRLIRCVQPKNASAPTLLIDEGIVTSVILVLFLKAALAMDVTLHCCPFMSTFSGIIRLLFGFPPFKVAVWLPLFSKISPLTVVSFLLLSGKNKLKALYLFTHRCYSRFTYPGAWFSVSNCKHYKMGLY